MVSLLVRSVIKNIKISNKLKKEIMRPTKIYSREILKLANKKSYKCCCIYYWWWIN